MSVNRTDQVITSTGSTNGFFDPAVVCVGGIALFAYGFYALIHKIRFEIFYHADAKSRKRLTGISGGGGGKVSKKVWI